MVHVNGFTYGALTPVLGYALSTLGCFLGLRCTTRARALHGAQRARWLLLAALSIATTGIWVMHFVAMLGFTIPGQTITYDVPVTILSMLIALAVVFVGLLIVGFGSTGWWTLALGGLIIGCGVASMHYVGMAAMRMPDTMGYDSTVVVLSVLIAVVAGTAALWAALRLTAVWSTLAASLIMGVAVSGMHYTGMAAMHVYSPAEPGMLTAHERRGQRRGVPAATDHRHQPAGIRRHRGHLAVAHRGGDPGRRRADGPDHRPGGRGGRAGAAATQVRPGPPGSRPLVPARLLTGPQRA